MLKRAAEFQTTMTTISSLMSAMLATAGLANSLTTPSIPPSSRTAYWTVMIGKATMRVASIIFAVVDSRVITSTKMMSAAWTSI